MSITYTCIGSVRGCCGTQHRSLRTAAACINRERAAVRSGHGASAYSDRWVQKREDGDPVVLTDDEIEEFNELLAD